MRLEKISSDSVKDILTNRLELDTRVTVLGHTQRGGPPCAYDRWLSTLQGIEAVNAVLSAGPGIPTPVITIRENKIGRSSLVDAVKMTKTVSQAIKEKDFDKAMDLRDAEFREHHNAYLKTTTTDHPKMMQPSEKVWTRPDL